MRARKLVSILGGVSGLLVPLLVIADVGLGVRLGFAVVAALALVARLLLAPRDPSDASPLVVALPVTVAALCALLSHAAGDPRAAAIAVLAGLSASIAIAVEESEVASARGERGGEAREHRRGRLDVASPA